MADRGPVAQDAVAPAARTQFGGRRLGWRDEAGRADRGGSQARLGARVQLWRLPGVQELERGVEIVDVERARDIGAAEAELAGRTQGMGQGSRGLDAESGLRGAVGGCHGAAVPERDLEGTIRQGTPQLFAKRSRTGREAMPPYASRLLSDSARCLRL